MFAGAEEVYLILKSLPPSGLTECVNCLVPREILQAVSPVQTLVHYGRQEQEHQHIHDLHIPSSEPAGEDGLLHIHQVIVPEGECGGQTLHKGRHGLHREREPGKRKRQDAVQRRYAYGQAEYREHTYNKEGHALAGKHHHESPQEHVPYGAFHGESGPSVEHQVTDDPQGSEQNGVGDELAEHSGRHGAARLPEHVA